MKTKIKRHSRAVMSVVLSVCILISCLTVGLIATDAAKVTDGHEAVGAIDDSETVGAHDDYGNGDSSSGRKYLYIDLNEYGYKDSFASVEFFWNLDGDNLKDSAGTKNKSDMTVVAPYIYKIDLSTVNSGYYDLSGIKIDFGQSWTWNQRFNQRNSNNNNCLKISDASWSTEFNLWYGSSDTGLNTALFLASGGVNFPLTTSNTFINVVNAAYDSWNSAGSVWSSSSTIDKMIDSNDDIIFKERKDQNSTTYYALIKAKNSTAAKYSQVLTYSKDNQKLTITSTPPASYNIAVDNADDCAITAVYNGTTKTNGETLTGVFVDETVSITVTPNLESKKVTAISATGAGNAVTGLTNNGDGTYSATLTVAAAGKISATLEDKARYTVTLNQASNGTATATVGGVAQESPFTVYEDTSVTFTAEPDEGYAFTGWSGSFTDKTSTVAKTITGTTTVTPTYAVDGYKMLFSENGTKAGTVVSNMIKLPNGHWISASPIPKTDSSYKTNLFTIQRNSDGYYVHSGATGSSYVINNGNHIDLSDRWYEADVKDLIDHQFYSNDIANGMYLVYAPEENKLYLTDNDGDHGDVAILAKDGTIRDWSGKTFTSDFGDTHITIVTPNDLVEDTDYEYDQYSYKTNSTDNNTARAEYIKFKGAAVNRGVTINVKTTVNSTYAALGYYVKGFVVSTEEESYAVIDQEFGDDAPYNELPRGTYSSEALYDKIHGVKSSDEYTTLPYNEFNFTIKGYPTTGIEITPIYYVAEAKSGDNVRFYVEGFEGQVKEKWTNMLAVDVYGQSARPFGEYPGQPMIKYNGRYVVDIPRKDIRGITLNNYYWDMVHSHYYGVKTNFQTYDYNDFVYINDMLTAHGKDEDIVFSFRYKCDGSHNTQASSNLADRVYYKDSEDIYGKGKTENDDHTVHADDYRTGYATMTSAHEAMYDFEPLTDFYGNRVDVFGNLVDTEANATKAAYNPLRIVSNGYDLNKAGRFATAWALYQPNSWTAADAGTYTLADIVGGQGKADQSFQSESFLIDPDSEARVRFKYDASIRDDTTLASTKYTDAVGDETILGYWQRKFQAQNNNSTSYPSFVADLAGVPAVITYEYEVGDEMPNKDLESTATGANNDKNYAYRSDGRWFYSSADELVQAHVIVEYADKEGGTFVRDYFQTSNYDYTSGDNYVRSANTGLATGIKAYFTNDGTEEREGKTFSNTYGYTEANGITDGKYTFDLETVGDEDGNYSFVGWYMLINGEYSFVTKDEKLISEATNNDVYVARYVKVPSGNLQITHALTSDSAGDATCYVKAEIYESDGTTLVDNTSYPYTTSAIKIDTKYIKANSNRKVKITLKTVLGSNTTFDQFKEKVGETLNQLTAESTLGLTATVSIDTSGTDMYAYITFPISALFDEDGNQTVKSTPFFSKTHLPEYKYEITYNFGSRKLIQNGKLSNTRLWGDQFYKYKGTFTDEEVEQYLDLSGTPTFKSAETANYLAEHSPYEKNFLEDTVWDFNSQTISYNASTLTFSCSLTAAQTTNTDINVTFKLPFDYTLNTTTPNNYTFSVTKASETDKPVYKDYKTVTQHESVTMDFLDWFSLNGVKNKTQMSSENQPEFLKVPDVLYNDATNPTKKRTFKYWAFFKEGDNIDKAAPYQKCYSSALNQAVYQDTVFYPVYTAELEMSAEEIKEVASNKSATITFLGVTRDQWNYNGGNTANSIWGSKFADRIFTDFVLSFEYENILIPTNDPSFKTGLIIQTLDTPAGGIENAKPESLATAYASSNGKDAAITKIKNTASDISESGVGTYLISYNQQALDDRNAIEYYYGIANVSQSTNPTNDTYTTPTNRRNYGYRAYSFIKKGTGNSAEVIISDPVYFTIYDVASIRNGSEQVASGS